jgi:LmbE family N-acetylglucosaminyl deacetylase
MSCGELIERKPGTIVVTVCSGRPGEGVYAEQWDANSGFLTGDEAAETRRQEDLSALDLLGAMQCCLGFLDDPYREKTGRVHEAQDACHDIAQAIAELLDRFRPDVCLFPLGLGPGGDAHETTSNAAVAALGARPWCEAIAYADLPYAFTYESRVAKRLSQLGKNWKPLPVTPKSSSVKRAAVLCYTSQHE